MNLLDKAVTCLTPEPGDEDLQEARSKACARQRTAPSSTVVVASKGARWPNDLRPEMRVNVKVMKKATAPRAAI